MKKLFLTSAMILAVGAANAANPYASLKAGYANSSLKYGYEDSFFDRHGNFDGFTLAAAGGLAFAVDPAVTLRGEVEYAYTDVSAKPENWWGDPKLSVSGNTIMLNGYADFGYESWAVKPYVGFGAGFGFGNKFEIKYSGSGHKNDMWDGFAYAGMVGASWQATNHLAVDLELKYKVLNGANYDWWYERTDFITRSVMLGARYAF
ncbi:MAG: outer membrane beta-barrel protein [Alphaproteobacteria bacterium]|nr:outer membrane beta-barrel protein [Alphaproteobacteria bacterium]